MVSFNGSVHNDLIEHCTEQLVSLVDKLMLVVAVN